MKPRILTCFSAVTLVAALTIPVGVAAQDRLGNKDEHPRYILIDLGTLGGPASYIQELQPQLSNGGLIAGSADTSIPDPNPSSCLNKDCFVSHGFQWRKDVLTDLGALAGGGSSVANAINSRGWVAGFSQNGLIDPLTGQPEQAAVLWKDGRIINLGTLGGNESNSISMNDRGHVIGVASNEFPDPFSFFGATQARAFLWENGAMRDLGTLGGPDAFAQVVNDRGQIAGFSYTNSTPNPTTGIPTVDPFIWNNGTMLNLGSLGGTFGQVNHINNRGQVVGTSNGMGDLSTYPFLWDQGTMRNLGTFGGSRGAASWINEAGEIAGQGFYPDDETGHAALWRDGVIKDLGAVAGDRCSGASAINSRSQIIGVSWAQEGFCVWPSPSVSAQHAFLWENGYIFDLNSLIPRGSPLRLVTAFNINERGEILGVGLPPGVPLIESETAGHAYVLIPCNENCQKDNLSTNAEMQNDSAPAEHQHPTTAVQGSRSPIAPLDRIRARLAPRYHIPRPAGPKN